jgi:hypothetical protein
MMMELLPGCPGDAYYPSIGSLVWVCTASAHHWAGRVRAPLPGRHPGMWHVQRESVGEQGQPPTGKEESGLDSAYPAAEWVHWKLLRPRTWRAPVAAAAASGSAAVVVDVDDASREGGAMMAAGPGTAAVEVTAPGVALSTVGRRAAAATAAAGGGGVGCFSIASFNMLINEWFASKYHRYQQSLCASPVFG